MKKVFLITCVIGVLLLSAACGRGGELSGGGAPGETEGAAAYQKISPEEAKRMMDASPDMILLDVRTREEFSKEHIGGAMLLPHTDIESEASGLLPRKDAVILVYCRTGVRSEAAARALIEMGYTGVYDIGGIEDWPYETVSEEGGLTGAPGVPAGEVVISFDYEKQAGSASNQFAVWIEDMDGRLVKTLFATRFTADGGYDDRPDSIPVWVGKSGLASMPPSEVDAVSGATPAAGTLSYVWDLTGSDGAAVLPGSYAFFVEGTLRWKNQVIYTGVIALGDDPVTAEADAEFIYEGSGAQPALTDGSPEHGMISGVTAVYAPGGTP